MIFLNTTISLTDWIQAIGVLLGVPATIIGFFALFQKSKKNEEKLQALGDIAISQNALVGKVNSQIVEMQNQSEIMKAHNVLVKEGNDILKEQITTQYQVLLDNKTYKKEYLSIVEKSRLHKLKPFFVHNGGAGSQQSFTYNLKNIGERAIIAQVPNLVREQSILNPQYRENDMIEKDAEVSISITPKMELKKQVTELRESFELHYTDAEGNGYEQNIKFNGHSLSVSKPERILI
jgi:hypothetical protein